MPIRTGLWTEVTASEHGHERAALHWIRERFPTREPFRAWSNFTFLADDGTRNEVDLLVVSPTGVYLVEVKSYPGRIDGDAGTWVWTSPEGKQRTFDNPIILAERKAKKLKSLLMKQPSLRNRRGPQEGFFLRSVVFLSNKDLAVGLNALGRTDVYGPDTEGPEAEQRNKLPGLIQLFKKIDPRRGRQVDRPLSQDIADAMDKAGIRESTTHRQVGNYELGELLAEGEGWQDFAAAHPEMRDTHRRIRIYLTGEAHDEEERSALQRAAEREFRFLQHVDHRNIEKPVELLRSPRGPALVFPHYPDAQRLDHWLNDNAAALDLADRIELVRQLGETLRHAHRQGLYHRALTAHHIWVSESFGKPVLRIRDWQTALLRLRSGTSGASGTEHVADMVTGAARLYLAPETLSVPNPQPAPADIWSLGAVAFLILSGRPPAADPDDLHEQLRGRGYLTLVSAMDAPPIEIDRIIRNATLVDASERFVSVDEFLEFLDLAFDELTAPDPQDPLDASKGDVIDETWKVLKRVGSGRTSVVFLVAGGERQEVLKVARSDEHGQRLRDEYQILGGLRDRAIIETYGLDEIAGRMVLRLEPALETLGEVLRRDGPLSLDLLDRFGHDLLDAVAYLDDEGVAHRDIKPDNIGIAERGKDKERHLVLFDFSLSRADPSDIRVGTVGYLDPFLEERDRRRWDDQAERYAVAVTLYEMTTGTLPAWGDGSTDPLLTDRQLPAIEDELFDASVRKPLTRFFELALHRNPARRFDTVGDMRRAWDQVFAEAQREVETEPPTAVEEIDLTDVTAETLLAELPLAAKVRNAIERLGAATAGELAGHSPAHLVRLSGIGAATRREVTHLAQRLREALAETGEVTNPDSASIDRIAEQLVPKRSGAEEQRTALSSFLEITSGLPCRWPTMRDVAEGTGLDPDTVRNAVTSGRNRWLRRPDVTAVRQELVELLVRRGGIAGAEDLAGTLLTSRGSLATGDIRSRRTRAVVRAALEAESARQEPRFLAQRLGSALLVALDGTISTEDSEQAWNADRLTEAAAALGEVAQDLAAREPLLASDQVLCELRAVELPEGVGPFSDARLVRLAAAAAESVSVSTRLELYPSGMDADRALRESRSVLLDRNGLDPDTVHSRVRARFPDVGPLPGRPRLDRVLEPLGLGWQNGRYVLPERGGVLSTLGSSSPRSTTFSTPDARETALREFDARLLAVQESGGFLVLTVDRRWFAQAAQAVAARVEGTVVDLDRELIDAMKMKSDELGARWAAFLDADAKRGQPAWTRLGQLVDRTVPEVESALLQRGGLVVATGIGLLLRYDRSTLLERLRDTLTRGRPKQPLKGLILIVPGADPTARPAVDGVPVPVITANQWAHLPSAWLAGHGGDRAA